MAITERGLQLDFQCLDSIQRPYNDRRRLELGGPALFVDAEFVLSLREKEEEGIDGVELGITRDTAVPVALVKRSDMSIRVYGSLLSHEKPDFATIGLGFRPGRPFIFINNGYYKLTFEMDDPTSLSFSIESKMGMCIQPIPGDINFNAFMRNLFEQRKLYVGASKSDIQARIQEQARKYLELLGLGKLTPEWVSWAARHRVEIDREKQAVPFPTIA